MSTHNEAPPTLRLPDDFPAADLTAFMLRVDVLDSQYRSHNNGQPSTPWREFASAAEGLRVRFRALAESDDAFRVVAPRFAETHEDRYEEERSLFAFFTSLVSTFETACYMFHALGGQLNAVAFPMVTDEHLKSVGPRLTEQRFAKQYRGEPLTAAIGDLLASPYYAESYEFRNVLSHRGNVPKNYHANIVLGGPPVVIGGINSTVVPTIRGVPMDSALTSERRAWIATWLRGAMTHALTFADTHIQ
jgi:hypothetical protein